MKPLFLSLDLAITHLIKSLEVADHLRCWANDETSVANQLALAKFTTRGTSYSTYKNKRHRLQAATAPVVRLGKMQGTHQTSYWENATAFLGRGVVIQRLLRVLRYYYCCCAKMHKKPRVDSIGCYTLDHKNRFFLTKTQRYGTVVHLIVIAVEMG